MKFLLATLSLALLGSNPALAQESPSLESQAKKSEAQRFAKRVPPTLVVRRAPDGSIAVYHAPSTILEGVKLGGRPHFEQGFATNEQMAAEDLSARSWRRGYGGLGTWSFFWNFFNAASRVAEEAAFLFGSPYQV